MIPGILRFVIFRVFGARVLLALTALGWLRNRLSRRDPNEQATRNGARRTG